MHYIFLSPLQHRKMLMIYIWFLGYEPVLDEFSNDRWNVTVSNKECREESMLLGAGMDQQNWY